jgi:hypothetical protein
MRPPSIFTSQETFGSSKIRMNVIRRFAIGNGLLPPLADGDRARIMGLSRSPAHWRASGSPQTASCWPKRVESVSSHLVIQRRSVARLATPRAAPRVVSGTTGDQRAATRIRRGEALFIHSRRHDHLHGVSPEEFEAVNRRRRSLQNYSGGPSLHWQVIRQVMPLHG